MKAHYFLLYILYVMGTSNDVSSTPPCRKKHCRSKSPDSQSNDNTNSEWSKISQMQVITTINNRYSTTAVTKTVVSLVNTTMKFYFSHLIPNHAIITAFVIKMNNKNYRSFILDDEKARRKYDSYDIDKEYHGSASARDTQKFSISVDLEANSLTIFYLTYEELLRRNHGRYEYCLNIYPGQLVKDIQVGVHLQENSEIFDLEVPNLRTGNVIGNKNKDLDPQALILKDDHSGLVKFAMVLFTLNETQQINFARIMKTEEENGFAGQFIVQYDVKNHQEFGEILVRDGYFVNFFAPKELPPVKKHVVFILDTSTSMRGLKIEQLKEAMKKVLNQIREDDLISLIQFNHKVKVWNLDDLTNEGGWFSADERLDVTYFPYPSYATSDHIKHAHTCVEEFNAGGGRDILSAIQVGFKLVELGRYIEGFHQPIIMFLTDGEPTRGETSHDAIIEEVRNLNRGLQESPLSTLAFGDEADENFLHKLAILTSGFFKHIYEAEDSAIQIEDFYNTISIPVLENINFEYNSYRVSSISRTKFPVYYDGSDLVVTGKYDPSSRFEPPQIYVFSSGWPDYQVLEVQNSSADISHIWAFVTVKQLLNDIEVNRNNTKKNKKRILKLSARYSFVTPYSSMVIVKPNDEMVVLGTSELTGQST